MNPHSRTFLILSGAGLTLGAVVLAGQGLAQAGALAMLDPAADAWDGLMDALAKELA